MSGGGGGGGGFLFRGGMEGNKDAYRLVCSEDFEQHVMQFLLHQQTSSSSERGPHGPSGGGDPKALKGSFEDNPFRIYSPDQVLLSVGLVSQPYIQTRGGILPVD
jgi:hypothetical protein